jgi:hypothetical protein
MKISNDTIGNRTRELPTCSAVPQPTALPRAPITIHMEVTTTCFSPKGPSSVVVANGIFFHIFVMTVSNLTSLLTNWLGRHARVADHLAVKNVAQGAPLGGGSALHRTKMMENLLLFLLYSHLLRLLLIITTLIFTLNVFSSVFTV